MPIRCVIFDFDGTLVDSNEIKRRTFYEVIQGIDDGKATMEDLLAAPDRGDRYVTFRRFAKRLGLGTQEGEQLAREYGRRCEECIACCPEIPGAEAALIALQVLRMSIYINSATHEVDLGAVLRRRGWSHLVDGVFGAPRSKIDNLFTIMEAAECSAAETVVIGDGKDDLAAARAAGCRFVGVGTRFAQCRGFEGNSLPTLGDLPEALARGFNQSRHIWIHNG